MNSNDIKSHFMYHSIEYIFDFKGIIAPIAEKSHLNFDLKFSNPVNRQSRLHYFAIGHTFKNIETEEIFEVSFIEELKAKQPTKFLSLQLKRFDQSFIDELKSVINNIRNINSHYIHELESLKTDSIPNTVQFLKESFELAIIQIYLKEYDITYDQFIKKNNTDHILVEFLYSKFKEQQYKDDSVVLWDHFRTLSKDKAIDALLFIEVENDFKWKLFNEHEVFTITSGKYLSFYACLFLLSMFLYRSEAN